MTSKYIRRLMAPLALAFAVGVAACGPDTDDSLAQDSALQSDLTLAGQDTAAQPGLSDVPAGGQAGGQVQRPAPQPPARRPSTTTPSGNTKTTTPGASAQRTASVPAGTQLTLNAQQRVCTNTNRVGDTFTATVAQTVTAGGVTIPAGAQVRLKITQLQKSENVNDQAVLAFVVERISINGQSFPVQASIASADVEQVRTTSKGSDAKKVIGGAVIGAAIGQILGKDTRSTVTGAAAGAAAGTAAAIATGDYDACVPSGGAIRIALTAPLTITTGD